MTAAYSASEIRFHALRNALYHTARRRHLEWWNRILSMLVIVLGTAAAANAADLLTGGAVVLGGATALVGALQLVFDFGGRARTHELLQRRYFDLLAELHEFTEPSLDHISRLNGALIRIYGDEPPVAQIDEALAYNEAMDALGADREDRMIVPTWKRIVASIFPIVRFNLVTVRERNQAANIAGSSRQS